MSRTPDYVLTEDVYYKANTYDEKQIPAGSFVRPIELSYVPKHIIEDTRWRWFNKDLEVFCYTHYGILPIAKDKMRQV